MLTTQLVVIGAGPGGYVAAFRAADLGLKVTLIDKAPNPGGICLYEGCIPSKALLHVAKVTEELSALKHLFVQPELPQLNIDNLRAHKNKIVERLTNGLGALTKQRKITYIQGSARFLNSTTLDIAKKDGVSEQISFEKAIIATGSRPVSLPFLPASSRIWDSSAALSLPSVPSTLLVIGGGYIGLELGTAYASFGSQVSVVEALPYILPNIDKDLVDIMLRHLKRTFSSVSTAAKVVKAEEAGAGIRVTVQDSQGQESTGVYDQLLVSVGRRPNTDGLGLENTKVQLTENGFIEVDERRRTDEKNIYAIGDVAGNPMLAHKASLEGKVAAESVAGQDTVYAPAAIPAVVFTDPEIAWCGLTESEGRAKGLDLAVSAFPWGASGRAVTLNRTDGITKIIADKKTGRLLGVGIVGANAGELIAEGTLAVETRMKAEDLSLTVHPHPTLSETMLEAAEGLFGVPTHIFKPGK